MSEPYWSALGGGVVDYEGAWSAAKAYAPGDVVRHNGVDFLAVNPSTGVDPGVATGIVLPTVPLVIALPASPVDGQEIILTDSLTAGTYHWHLKYVAARASNKWVFIGGAPASAGVVTDENATATTYAALATPGPSITIPVLGDYIVNLGMWALSITGGQLARMSFDIGGTAAVDADAVRHQSQNQPEGANVFRQRTRLFDAVTLTAKYKVSVATVTIGDRWISILPIAVGG